MTNPKDFNELKTLVNTLESRIGRLETSPLDLKKRQITNLPAAKLPSDAVPLSQLQDLIQNIKTTSLVQNFNGSATPALQIGLAYNSANQSIPSATTTELTFNTNVRDTGIHSTSVNPTHFTVPSDGLYLCYSQVQWASAPTVGSLLIYVNGAFVAPAHADSSSSVYQHVFGILSLLTGDVITFRAVQSSGGAINALGSFSLGGVWRIGS